MTEGLLLFFLKKGKKNKKSARINLLSWFRTLWTFVLSVQPISLNLNYRSNCPGLLPWRQL